MGVAAIQDSKLSAGTHTITATYSGDSSFTASSGTLSCGLVVVGPVSLSRSTISATPASVAVNGKVTVTLTARDANGNQELGGGLTVAFGLTTGSAGGSFGTVTDNKNGTYTATFTATKVGSDTITATIGGAAVTSTPPIVKVTSSSASLSQSTVTVSSGSVAVGGKITVALTAQDDHGNQQLKGGLAVKFVLASGSAGGIFGPVTRHKNGTYTATFTPSRAGTNTIIARIDGVAVTSTPPTVTVTPRAAIAFPLPRTLAAAAVSLMNGTFMPLAVDGDSPRRHDAALLALMVDSA